MTDCFIPTCQEYATKTVSHPQRGEVRACDSHAEEIDQLDELSDGGGRICFIASCHRSATSRINHPNQGAVWSCEVHAEAIHDLPGGDGDDE